MQPIEDFMREFFRSRAAEFQREMKDRQPFREKFFTPGCWWASRKGEKDQNDSETIESVSLSSDEAKVITRLNSFIPRLRYHLQKMNDSWQIHCVEVQCPYCQGQRSAKSCGHCKDTGWKDPSEEKEDGNQ
jgi:hypothetical protein